MNYLRSPVPTVGAFHSIRSMCVWLGYVCFVLRFGLDWSRKLTRSVELCLLCTIAQKDLREDTYRHLTNMQAIVCQA